ncbi:MAG: hypothetical protein I8H75_04630 [Myxococcaceae bacterium]|nr:hypothetical protein [Myxococcaceae bacterium]MBH2006609.1 hypothetical protein [Myxococcaceae bacterium]
MAFADSDGKYYPLGIIWNTNKIKTSAEREQVDYTSCDEEDEVLLLAHYPEMNTDFPLNLSWVNPDEKFELCFEQPEPDIK